MNDKYKFIGPAYDWLSQLYGGKSILKCKTAMLNLDNLNKGDKVLFAGAGHGKDAIYAAQLGMDVTIVELSATMLQKFKEGVEKTNPELRIRAIQADIMTFDEPEQYDMVVANFFLNVFEESFLPTLLNHLNKMVKPGGKLVIGDFEIPTGSLLKQAFQKLYWYTALTLFHFVTQNPMHRIYNYPKHLEKIGLPVQRIKHYSVLGINLYWSMMVIKPITDMAVAA